METSSMYEKNPWKEENSSLSALKQAISLAQRTGHIQWKSENTENREILESARQNYISLQFIDILKMVEERRKRLDSLLLEIQVRLQYRETSDLTHTEILDERIADISKLNNHLQTVVSQKDQLISRLQKPYIGDFLRIEAPYKSDVAKVFPLIVPILSNLNCQLENIDSINKLKLGDGQLEAVLADISTNLAALQTGFQNIARLRDTISQIHGHQSSQQSKSSLYASSRDGSN